MSVVNEIIIKLMKEEANAIVSYTKAINELPDGKVKVRLREIRSDEEQHFKELNDLLS